MSRTKTKRAAASLLGAGQVKARVLIACEHGAANEVVVLDEAAAASGVEGGLLDTADAAVAYAESLAPGGDE